MKLKSTLNWFLMTISVMLLTACGGGSEDSQTSTVPTNLESQVVMATLETQDYRIYLPDVGNDINASTLIVKSFAEDYTSITDLIGVLRVLDPEGNTIFLSYSTPGISVSLSPESSVQTVDNKIDFSIRSTAYSLVLMIVSPSLNASEKSEVSGLILGHSDFDTLVKQMDLAYKANPRYLEVLGDDTNLVDSISALAKNVLQQYVDSGSVSKSIKSIKSMSSKDDTWNRYGPIAQPQLGLADNGDRLAIINTNTIFWGAKFKSCDGKRTETLIVPRVTSYNAWNLFSTSEVIKELAIGEDITNETVFMEFYSNNDIELWNYFQLVVKVMSISGNDLHLQKVIDSVVEGRLIINDYTECLYGLDGITNKELVDQKNMIEDAVGCVANALVGTAYEKAIAEPLRKDLVSFVNYIDETLLTTLKYAWVVHELATEAVPVALQIEEAKGYGNAYFALTWDGERVSNILNNNVMPTCSLETLLRGKTFYQHWGDNESSWIDTLTFDTVSTFTVSNSVETEIMTYTINGDTLTLEGEDNRNGTIAPFTEILGLTKVTDTYIELGNSQEGIFYFTEQLALAAPPFIDTDTGSESGGCPGEINSEGVCTKFYPSGERYSETPYLNGAPDPDGTVKRYHESGPLLTITPYLNGVIEGIEIRYSATGARYEDTLYENGVRIGIVKQYYANGVISFEATYVNGVLNGDMINNYESGSLWQVIPYVNGVMHGTAINKDENGILQQVTPYVNGVIHGTVTAYYYGSTVIERETPYVYGIIEGIVKYYDETGTLRSETLYKNDVEIGILKVYYENGFIARETPYLNGVLHGDLKEYYETTNEAIWIITPYLNGVIEGTSRGYYESGKPQSLTLFVNGMIEGTAISYYENGIRLEETPYENGVVEGIVKYYDESGTLIRETLYVNGIEIGIIRQYYSNGFIASEYSYVNGVMEGTVTGYYETTNEAIQSTTPYVNGVIEGTVTSYYESRSIQSTETYINGISQGDYVYYPEAT